MMTVVVIFFLSLLRFMYVINVEYRILTSCGATTSLIIFKIIESQAFSHFISLEIFKFILDIISLRI